MKRLVLGTAALTALCVFAADELQPIKAKLGLWEVTRYAPNSRYADGPDADNPS